MTFAPTVSVVMPAFNAAKFLDEAVCSILDQTFRDFEFIIVDDGSTDDALDNISDIDEPRIRIIRNDRNLGPAAARNIAIDRARGEYLALMDADDVAYPERLAKQVNALRQDPQGDLVAVRCLTISADNEPIGLLPFARSHEELTARPWLGFYLPGATWMGRTEWFRRYRYTIPEAQLIEDQELLLRSYASSQFSTIPEVLYGYRLRTKKDWRKLARTRWALLKVQLYFFARSGKLLYGLLSLFAFGARMGMDLINTLNPGGRWLGPLRSMHIDNTELIRWRAVLRALEEACGARRCGPVCHRGKMISRIHFTGHPWRPPSH